MKIYETKANNLLSYLIIWCFSSKGSHILFSFDNDKWVVHSNLIGVNIRLFKNFMKNVQIVDCIEYQLDLIQEEQIFQTLLEETSEDSYDLPGFMYFAWRGVLFKLFQIQLPKINKWGKSKMHLCTEMIKKLPNWLTNLPDDIDLGMTTPDKAMLILKEAKK